MATEDGKSNESSKGHAETSKDAGWMDDCILNPELVRHAQEKEAIIGLFLQYKKKGDKTKWNDISVQGVI